MARNEKSFAVGNSHALRLTPEISRLFINTISLTGRVTIAAQRCCISLTTAKEWIRKGREPGADEIFREFADGVSKARSEFLLLASRRLNQLAVGGLITLPAYDKTGSPIRKHEKDCAAIGPCQCELVMVEKVLLPNPNVLMWQVDRVDPQPREPEPEAPHSSAAELSTAEQIAEASKYFDLFRAGIQTLLDLGVPLPQIAAPLAIETTSAKVEPEPATIDVTPADEPAKPTEPPKSDPEPF